MNYLALALQGDYEGALRELAQQPLGSKVMHQAMLYALGRIAESPSADGLSGEDLAFVLMLQATHSLEKGDEAAARATLRTAIDAARPVSPELTVQLLEQLASLESDSPASAIQHLREAIALTDGLAKANLFLQLGIALQDASHGHKAALVEAVKAYQEALRFGITIESKPESYALLQNNLALAYLATPMTEVGDQLRMGIAVQSLREALKVYTKEVYPEQWASAQLNLANALQYIPTSHPEENLIRAVEIYDEILSVRTKAFDPVGYARLLANQANALAHLGIFSPAMEKISEAYKLFQWHDEPEMAAAAMGLVENISQQRGHANGSA